jgi:dienelactone hydrolase
MAEILLFHSVLGLRPVELELAEEWRSAGHDVVTPDLFDGRTAETYNAGFVILEDIGLQTVVERAVQAAEKQSDNVVLAGVSMGAGMAARAWAKKTDASGVLFVAGPAPWPEKVADTPVQMHAARPEPFDAEEVFNQWRTENPGVKLEEYRYDGVGHYFLDSSLPDYSETASNECRRRCIAFLDALQR